MKSSSLTLSLPKWFCLLTLALVGVTLIGESLALIKCEVCMPIEPTCELQPCVQVVGPSACLNVSDAGGGKRLKKCYGAKHLEAAIGKDKCKDVTLDEFEKQSGKVLYEERKASNLSAPMTFEDFLEAGVWGDIKRNFKNPGDKKLSICSCSTDSCNADANDKKPGKGTDAGTDTGSAKGSSKATILKESGNLVASVFLAWTAGGGLVLGVVGSQ